MYRMTRYTCHVRQVGILVTLVALATGICAGTTTVSWIGASGDWSDGAQWDGAQPPAVGDDVIVPAGGSVTLTNTTVLLASLTVRGTLTFSHWETALHATDVDIESGGIVTHTLCDTHAVPGNTNRVHIVCSNLTVAAGGTIQADMLGYRGAPSSSADPKEYYYGQGPGGGYRKGGGYGGMGARSYYDAGAGGQTYGSSNAPVEPGSGGGNNHVQAGGAGGGAILIEADGIVRVDGTITANGKHTNGQGCGGSGGGIYILCHSLEGDGDGIIRAEGGDGNFNPGGGGGGGGGRVAVAYGYRDAFYGLHSVRGGDLASTTYGQPGTFVSYYTGSGPLLTLAGNPDAYGTPAPQPYGRTAVPPGTIVTNTVTYDDDFAPGVKRACVGFVVTTNEVLYVADDTSSALFTMPADDAELTWNWTNRYQLTVATVPGPGGTVNSQVNGFYTNGMVAQISAVATGTYSFTFWTGDIPFAERASNPVTVTMDQVRTIQANFESVVPKTRVWRGAGAWSSATNWTPAGVPGSYDTVIVEQGEILLDNPVTVDTLLMSNNTVVTFSGWNTSLTAGEVLLANTAKMTHMNCDTNTVLDNTNRVYIVCSNLTIAAGAMIDVNYRGYRGGIVDVAYVWGQGPGAGLRTAGASYGGVGAHGHYTPNQPGSIYGSVTGPALPGSGGGGHSERQPGTEGGGAVQIEASGCITLYGTISADGFTKRNTQGGNGSGGGIHLACHTFVGTGGVLRAEGGGCGSHFSQGGAGGGGRIVVLYDTAAQAGINAVARPQVTISASQGSGDNAHNAQPGTIYLADSSFFPRAEQPLYGGQLLMPGFDTMEVYDLTVAGGQVVFPAGFDLVVSNNITVGGDGGGVVFTNARVSVAGDITLNPEYAGASVFFTGDAGCGVTLGDALDMRRGYLDWYCSPSGTVVVPGDLTVMLANLKDLGAFTWHGLASGPSTLAIGGNCLVTHYGTWVVRSGPTNTLDDGWGTQIVVGGDLDLATNATIRLYSDAFNGGSPMIRARNLRVAAGGVLTADAGGYAGALSNTGLRRGYGPGAGSYGGGGGYGGTGGRGGYDSAVAGEPYGSPMLPLAPGSGGGHHGGRGGSGGGLVWVEAEQTVTADGTISAKGGGGGHGQAGAGSGGGIYIQCRIFAGGTGGLLQADGGDVNASASSNGGAGGGGRIAVMRRHHLYQGGTSVTSGVAYADERHTGGVGTVRWLDQPYAGSLMLLR